MFLKQLCCFKNTVKANNVSARAGQMSEANAISASFQL